MERNWFQVYMEVREDNLGDVLRWPCVQSVSKSCGTKGGVAAQATAVVLKKGTRGKGTLRCGCGDVVALDVYGRWYGLGSAYWERHRQDVAYDSAETESPATGGDACGGTGRGCGTDAT